MATHAVEDKEFLNYVDRITKDLAKGLSIKSSEFSLTDRSKEEPVVIYTYKLTDEQFAIATHIGDTHGFHMTVMTALLDAIDNDLDAFTEALEKFSGEKAPLNNSKQDAMDRQSTDE